MSRELPGLSYQVLQFGNNKRELIKALDHPYVPPFARDTLKPLVLRARLVRIGEIERYAREPYSQPYWSKPEKEIQAELQGLEGLFYRGPLSNTLLILVNRDYSETMSDPWELDFHLKEVLTHEAGHGLSLVKTCSLTNLDDATTALLNFGTKQQVVDEFNQYRDRVGLPPVTNVDISAQMEGFKTEFKDKDGHVLPLEQFQHFIEETRATVLGHLLQIIVFGSGTPRRGSNRQFLAGKGVMSAFPQIDKVIDDYINIVGGGNIRKGVRGLFEDFYFKTANQFFAEREKIEASFLEATSYIINDRTTSPEKPID